MPTTEDHGARRDKITGIELESQFLKEVKPIELYAHWLGRLQKEGDWIHSNLNQYIAIQTSLIVALGALAYAFHALSGNILGRVVILVVSIAVTLGIIFLCQSYREIQRQQELWQTFFTIKLWQLEDHIFADRSAGLGASIERFGAWNVAKRRLRRRAKEPTDVLSLVRLIRSSQTEEFKVSLSDDVFSNATTYLKLMLWWWRILCVCQIIFTIVYTKYHYATVKAEILKYFYSA